MPGRVLLTVARRQVLPPGLTGYAAPILDGVDDKIDCGTGSTLAFTGAFTLIGWLKIRITPVAYASIIGRANGLGTKGYGLYYYAALSKWVWFVRQYDVIRALAKLPERLWFPIMLRYDGAVIDMTADGIKTIGTACTGDPLDGGVSLKFGYLVGFGYTSIRAWNWSAYSRALTDAEYAAFGRNEGIADTTGLVSTWKMEEGSGSTVADSVGANAGAFAAQTWGTDPPFKPRTLAGVRTLAAARTLHS
jgi:hypothetical protein